MDFDVIKIIASIIGIIFYLFFKKKDTKKAKPFKGPTQVASPIPPRKPKPRPEPEPEEDKGLKYEPVTFEQLLEQFGESKKKTMTRAEREEKLGIDDEFIPATDTQAQKMQELEQYYTELDDQEFAISADDLANNRSDNYKRKQKEIPAKRISQLLKNPESVRDAFIMKEIFDRKF